MWVRGKNPDRRVNDSRKQSQEYKPRLGERRIKNLPRASRKDNRNHKERRKAFNNLRGLT